MSEKLYVDLFTSMVDMSDDLLKGYILRGVSRHKGQYHLRVLMGELNGGLFRLTGVTTDWNM